LRVLADYPFMRIMPLDRAEGLRLARPIPSVDPRQMPLLRANAIVTPAYVRALRDLGIAAVWIQDEMSADILPEELVSAAVRTKAARTMGTALESARAAFQRGQGLTEAVVAQLDTVVDEIGDSVSRHRGASVALQDLAGSDAYTHQHSIDVCALGMLLGRSLFEREGWRDDRGRFRRDGLERRLHLLGLGLLLHDVGKAAIPLDVLNKPGRLSADEWDLMRGHPELGADLLTSDHYSPLVRSVVRDHHERWDGSGYPRGIAGREINQLARIAAVADVYDAITSARPYQAARPAHVGVQIILDGSGTAFDPEVVEVFREIVHPFPVGSEITLPDGEVGVVARVDPALPRFPWVRFQRGERPVDTDTELFAA
jgi:HD-GYP domain-containing protein (c-di-GMP phosphodiesterase class II)